MDDEHTTNIQSVIGNLNAATDELRRALDSIAQAQVVLQETEQNADLEALWYHLSDLGRPINNASVHVIASMREIGQQIGAKPHAPNQMDWLAGIDVRASQANQEIQQHANAIALLEWLEPYLALVSSRTRTAVIQAVQFTSRRGSQALIEGLTPETFRRDLHLDHSGFVANIRGLGPGGLRELREAMGVDRSSKL